MSQYHLKVMEEMKKEDKKLQDSILGFFQVVSEGYIYVYTVC